MVRKLLGVTTVAALMLGSSSAALAAPNLQTNLCSQHGVAFGEVNTSANGTERDVDVKYDIGIISYQALSSSGVTKILDAIVFPDGYPVTGDKVIISLENAEFANPTKVRLVYDNGTDEILLAPTTATSNKVEFELPNDVERIEGLVEEGVEDKISFKIPGTLKPKDRVKINVTQLQGTSTVTNGCIVQDLMIVEDQFIADSDPIVDNEKLAVAENGVTKLYDDEISETNSTTTVSYNPCLTRWPHDCEHECPSCDLICNEQNQGNCVLPSPCNTFPVCGLGIFQAADFVNGQVFDPNCDESPVVKPIISVSSLAESTVKLTLKGNFNGITSVTFYGSNGQTLCSATPENGEASCTVSGRNLFDATNKEWNGAVSFTFSVTVDGKTQLSPRQFSASAEISGGELAHPVYLNWDNVMTWGLDLAHGNALAFKVPYVRTDNYMTSAIRIENVGGDAPVAIYVTDPAGGWKLVKVLALKAGEEKIITGSDLVDWAKDKGIDLLESKSGRFGILAIASRDPNAKALDLNVYSAQQVKGTNNVRFVPVEVLSSVPNDLH